METYVLLDKLTGLYNSRTLVRELEQEISRAQRLKRPLTLCMIAVDGFAEFSKYQGALGADSVLKTIATTLKNTVRDIDVPARHTLEKFAVILPETNIAGAQVAAERIKRKITTALGAGHGLSHKLIVSVSVAAYPLHARKADELIEQASKALNFAMIQGGACIVEATVMH
jgi:diguanylate cyclase (GGDEF)-like protein